MKYVKIYNENMRHSGVMDISAALDKKADIEYVNELIQAATATFRGTYNVVTDLSLAYNATHSQIEDALETKMAALSIVPDNNDYSFVQIPTSDETQTKIAKVEKYTYNGSEWAYEYELNNSGFTDAQWSAINSGATLELIGKLSALPTNAELTTLLNAKVSYDDNGAYDVSAHNSGATFASLSALLSNENIDTLIPAAVRKGGMSIRFVQTSDNNYVQYRLMSDSFNTTPANWQGVDDKILPLSPNVPTSKAVNTAIDSVEYLINEKQIFVGDNGGWSSYLPISLKAGVEYTITNIGKGSIQIIEFRGGTTSAGTTGEIAMGGSTTFTPTRNVDNARAYRDGGIAVFSVVLSENYIQKLQSALAALSGEVDANALLVAQKTSFSGGGWTEMEYAMKSVLSYNIKKTSSGGTIIAAQAIDGNGQQVAVTGFYTLTNIGDNCNIQVARDAAKIKLYFDGGGKVEIKNNILDYVVSAIASINETDTKQNASIAELDVSIFNRRHFSGAGWGAWTAYDFRYNYPYTISNVSANANSKIIVFEMRVLENGVYRTITYRGDSISNLTPGQTATIIPNGNATEFRAYYDGGLGTIEISGTLDITNSVYDLLDGVQIQEGYSSKDQIKHQVIVAKDGADGHFATIAEAYASITDSSYTNQYEVIVYPGKYNELNLIPPAFTHTHGLAPNSVVVSSEGVNPSSTLPVFDQQVSSTKLSNMTIESHNGYCIHFDEKLSGQVIMNENLVLDKADTPNNTWYVVGGGSFQLGTKYIWKNCIFKCRGNYGQAACHTNGNLVNDNTHLIFDGCTFVHCNPRNGSVGGFGNCVVELVNCHFPIGERGLENWYSPIRNIDNPELYRFKKNEWQVIGGGNKNLSMWQLQNGKTIRLVADYPITISGSAASVIFGYNPYVNNIKTARLDCALTSEYYIDDSQAGYPPYSEAKDVYQLWKRLGDCSSENKTLTVTVNNVSKTYTFTEDYLTSKTAQATIIAAMQAVLDNVTIEAITDSGYGYDNVNTSDILVVKVTAADIMKGEFVTRSGAKATSSTPIADIIGVACEDKPINEYVKVWTSAFRFDTDYADGEYGLDANGALDSNAATKIGFIKGYNFYLY